MCGLNGRLNGSFGFPFEELLHWSNERRVQVVHLFGSSVERLLTMSRDHFEHQSSWPGKNMTK